VLGWLTLHLVVLGVAAGGWNILVLIRASPTHVLNGEPNSSKIKKVIF
jgi:hypothetical protein